MKTQDETPGIKLFIVDDNKLLVAGLKQYLQQRFGANLDVHTFYDGESCIKKIDNDTRIIILDYFLDGKNGLDVLKEIKITNPKTEVIMMSSNDDVGVTVDMFRAGAKDYIIKGSDDAYLKKIGELVENLISGQKHVTVKGFGK